MGRPPRKDEIEAKIGEPLEEFLARRYRREGKPLRAIAQELGIGVTTLSRWMREAHIPTRRWTVLPPFMVAGPSPIRIPTWAMFDQKFIELKPPARILYLSMLSYAEKDGWVGFEHGVIEQGFMGGTEEELRTDLKALEERGFIRFRESSERGVVYDVISPLKWEWRAPQGGSK